MTTSGVSIFSLTRNEFAATILRKLGVLAVGDAVTDTAHTENLTNTVQAMNVCLAYLRTIGMPLWARKEYQFAITTATAAYIIGVGQTIATPFPIKIHQALLVNTSTNSILEMEVPAIYDYYRMSPGQSSGTPIKLYYQPQIDFGTITLWPTPDTLAASTYQVRLIYTRPLEFFTASTETIDLPVEWYNAFIYTVADMLSPEYGLPLPDRSAIKKEAKEHRELAESIGSDNSSVYFVPAERRN